MEFYVIHLKYEGIKIWSEYHFYKEYNTTRFSNVNKKCVLEAWTEESYPYILDLGLVLRVKLRVTLQLLIPDPYTKLCLI